MEVGIRVATVLIDAVCWRYLIETHPLVKSNGSSRPAEIAKIFAAKIEIRYRPPELPTIDGRHLHVVVLVPDGPHPGAGGILGPQELRGRERAAVVENADQTPCWSEVELAPSLDKVPWRILSADVGLTGSDSSTLDTYPSQVPNVSDPSTALPASMVTC